MKMASAPSPESLTTARATGKTRWDLVRPTTWRVELRMRVSRVWT
jgi:hypothetical protein